MTLDVAFYLTFPKFECRKIDVSDTGVHTHIKCVNIILVHGSRKEKFQVTVGKLLESNSDIGCGQFKPQDFRMSIVLSQLYCSISVCGIADLVPSAPACSPHGVHGRGGHTGLAELLLALKELMQQEWHYMWFLLCEKLLGLQILTEPDCVSSSFGPCSVRWPHYRKDWLGTHITKM